MTPRSENEIGDPVHLEVDVLGKYAESMLAGERGASHDIRGGETAESAALFTGIEETRAVETSRDAPRRTGASDR